MDRLSVNPREVLVLRTAEEMSQAYTAQALGISGKAVETRAFQARKQLRELLGGRE